MHADLRKMSIPRLLDGIFLHIVIEQTWGGGVNDILLPKGPPFCSRDSPLHLLDSLFPLPEERHLSMLEIGEKERNHLFKSYTDSE